MKTPAIDAFTRQNASQIIYQIFPERFAIGGGLSSQQKLAQPAYNLPNAVKRDWDDATANQTWGHQFFGGDLDGITSRLDYLSDLGVTGIYLTPIFPAPSNHKYDATDLFSVDPMYGGEPALKRLISALHMREMSLTLDAVLNHVSAQHPWFLAAQGGDPYKRDWFTFRDDDSYLGWQDYGPMPELNLANPAVRDVLYRRPDSFVQHWLARGVDNWRFDLAADMGLAVAQEMSAVVGARFPEAMLLGEQHGFSGSWLPVGGGFHGTMNYWHRGALLAWLAGDIDAVQMNRAVQDAHAGFGLKALLSSWNVLSSHDTPRLLTSVGSVDKARLALLAQFMLPGVPLIYYGEEIGMQGAADPDGRQPMRWNEDEWDHAQRDWVKQLIAVRQANPALQYGDVTVLGDRLAGSNALVFLRHTTVPGEEALVIVNLADKPLQARLLLPNSHWCDGQPLRDALGRAPDTKVQAASVKLSVAPRSGAVYQATEPLGGNGYGFFKPRFRR